MQPSDCCAMMGPWLVQTWVSQEIPAQFLPTNLSHNDISEHQRNSGPTVRLMLWVKYFLFSFRFPGLVFFTYDIFTLTLY
jgi:hypothetical protein